MRRQGCHGIPAAAVGKTGNQDMEDARIVDLYWDRQEQAIAETQNKYGRYLLKIAWNVLADTQDSEESVNDTYLSAWKSMPPHRPSMLSTYLGKITRHLAIDECRRRDAAKRSALVCELTAEMEACLPGGNDVEEAVDAEALGRAINAYLMSCSAAQRQVFLLRYWHFLTIPEIATRCGFSRSKVKTILFRLREGLRKHLEQEGYAG